ncbi:alcohol dehydrogenase catalytic domain-containing protein, partial [Pseudomonas syringae]|uniref:alcohol dehydrogenase catalytic domain-containing protein n=1 Tax=Pseudomonas syringae TaxID=317 RepID=UPI0035B6214C
MNDHQCVDGPRARGMDFSGTVIAVGANVTRLKVGDAVLGLARFKESGAFAQAVVTKKTFLAKKPESLSFIEASASPASQNRLGRVPCAGTGPGLILQIRFSAASTVIHGGGNSGADDGCAGGTALQRPVRDLLTQTDLFQPPPCPSSHEQNNCTVSSASFSSGT